jgi:hypothetical protein
MCALRLPEQEAATGSSGGNLQMVSLRNYCLAYDRFVLK